MYKIGVIPAAGYGARWGYYPKFLLPCGSKIWLLDRAMRLFPCNDVAVVVSDQTRNEVYNHLSRCRLLERAIILENKHMKFDFWGSMLAALEIEADYYYFTMPDTYCPRFVFEKMPTEGFSMGVFYTETPERFGVLRGDEVINKTEGAPGLAWGMLGWDKAIRDLWRSAGLTTYTDAINLAIETTGAHTVEMAYYYDMAGWGDYVEFVRTYGKLQEGA